MTRQVLVTGAGGFIGGHLTARLLLEGCTVYALDRKPLPEWHQVHRGTYNLTTGIEALSPGQLEFIDEVYHLAADMGGIGYITNHLVACSHNIVDTLHLLDLCDRGQRVFFASSACVYPAHLQGRSDPGGRFLREADAIPADPEPGYGWEKLYAEQVMRYYHSERGVETRIGRYHNVYGPNGSFGDGREKAPAALCRKVAMAALTGEHVIQVWGDGEQTRSFMFVDDCVDGTLRTARHLTYHEPLNLGSDRWVTINDMITIIEQVAGIKLVREYQRDKPQGVRGRNSDNDLAKRTLEWEPYVSLETGLAKTYEWIYNQVREQLHVVTT